MCRTAQARQELRKAPPDARGRAPLGVEAAASPQAHQEANRLVSLSQTHLHGVVARGAAADGEWRIRSRGRCLAQPRADLLGCHCRGVFAWDQSAHAQGSGPTRTAAGHLHQPRIVPASHHRLTVGVAVRVRIIATRRTGFGVAAWPDTRTDRRAGGLGRERIGGDQALKLLPVHGARVEGILETAPATLTARDQTQMGGAGAPTSVASIVQTVGTGLAHLA